MTTEICKILSDRYGVGVIVASTATVLWAAARCSNPTAAVTAVNRVRERHGAPRVYVPYGYTFPR